MTDSLPFPRLAILGTGLIGASFGMALERAFPNTSVVAFDRPEVLGGIASRHRGWEVVSEIHAAVRGADLVYIALPVVAAIEMLPEIAAASNERALVTDACSTKVALCREAASHFAQSQFLGGHPIAGKEVSGFEHARAELFDGSRYVLVGDRLSAGPPWLEFAELLRRLGAEPVWCDAEAHDRAMAIVSHTPQLVALALARVIADETSASGGPARWAGPGLRDLLRTAGSPYHLWRDICLTNTGNIAQSLDRVAQAIDFVRTHLRDRELEPEFRNANELYKSLRDLQ